MTENYLFFKRINPILMAAKYLQGIPNLNNNFVVKFEPNKNGIHFIEATTYQKKFYLNKNEIGKISVEDQTTIENRVGFKRLLLVGIFAFAWKKRTSVSLSFLIFEYKNEFDEVQEMYIQSDKNTGFQDFTNIKYNLQKFWKESENNPNYDEIILRTEERHKLEVNDQNKKTAIGCFLFVIIFAIIWLISK